uniref:ABC transmembrane type-1 domain-containing protein n=1 Tax=Panagrolaimus sp. ES5 TaxID=591445 RepID=A0AC34G0Z6_9BILA
MTRIHPHLEGENTDVASKKEDILKNVSFTPPIFDTDSSKTSEEIYEPSRISNVLILYPPESPEFRKQANENVYIFLGLGGAAIIVTFFQFYCFQTVCNRLIARLRTEYVRSLIRQNAEWFDKNHSGILTSTLNENIERIQEGIGDKLGVLVRGLAMITAAIIISFIYEWRLSLIMLAMTPFSCAIMAFQSKKMEESTMKELNDVAQAGAIAEESIMGVRTVQAFNGQNEMVNRYKHELTKGKKYSIETSYWSGLLEGFFFFMLYTFLGIGILYGGYLLKVGVFSNPGDVFICIMTQLLGAYFVGLISPHLMVLLNARVAAAVIYETIDTVPEIDVYSNQGQILTNPKGLIEFKNVHFRYPSAYFVGLISPHLMVLLNARVAAAVIYETIDTVPETDVYSNQGQQLTNPKGMIEFKNVHFRYPSRKDVKVLNGLNLTIYPGQTVALVGHSGCGKSTSVGLLTRLYEAESGLITIDGMDVREINIQNLRHIVGIVQQEPTLFNDTIAENIRISNPQITEQRMIEVCKMANAHEFIQNLPKSYDTLIGDGGVQLSGGQKQRIAIAR